MGVAQSADGAVREAVVRALWPGAEVLVQSGPWVSLSRRLLNRDVAVAARQLEARRALAEGPGRRAARTEAASLPSGLHARLGRLQGGVVMSITIFGASDDLIEIEGEIDEEFCTNGSDEPVLLRR